MRAVGESLGLGRTFAEAFKAMDGREGSLRDVPGRRRPSWLRAPRSPCPSAGTCCSRPTRRGLELPGIHPSSSTRPARGGRPPDDVSHHPARRSGSRSIRAPVEFEARTPYYYVTHEGEGQGARSVGRERSSYVGAGPEPDRAGDKIRLLLRPTPCRRCGRAATRR